MVVLQKKNDKEFYITYTGSSMTDYMEYAKCLSSLDKNKLAYDSTVKRWYCPDVEAQKINDKLNNPQIGEMMKLKPYDYQRQAISFCHKEKSGLIQLPCGAGKLCA